MDYTKSVSTAISDDFYENFVKKICGTSDAIDIRDDFIANMPECSLKNMCDKLIAKMPDELKSKYTYFEFAKFMHRIVQSAKISGYLYIKELETNANVQVEVDIETRYIESMRQELKKQKQLHDKSIADVKTTLMEMSKEVRSSLLELVEKKKTETNRLIIEMFDKKRKIREEEEEIASILLEIRYSNKKMHYL